MVLDPEPIDKPRKRPLQARSKVTVSAILEAATQILAAEGELTLTTKLVAERAGVSIGTLYQYFPNRDAILLALAEEERQRIAESMRAFVGRINPSGPIDPTREFMRVLIHSYARRSGAKRQFHLIETIKSEERQPKLPDEFAEVLARCWDSAGSDRPVSLNKTHAYVLTHAILGVLRTASIDGSPLLKSRKLEDALCLMVFALRPSPKSPRKS